MSLKSQTIEIFNDYQEVISFTAVVFMGIFMKFYHAYQKGKKLTCFWFISEAIMSVFVALTVYAIFDQWLHLNQLLTYIICAWAGSFSTVFHKKAEELLSAAFDGLKEKIKRKLS